MNPLDSLCFPYVLNQDYLQTLADHLSRQQEAVVDEWMRICEEDQSLEVTSKLTRSGFRNNIPAAIEGLCAVLRAEEHEMSDVVQEAVSKHGHHRWKQGFSLKQLIRDWGHLNRALTRQIGSYFAGQENFEDDRLIVVHERLTAFITEAMTFSVSRFDELRRSEAESLTRDLQLARSNFETATQARGELLREATHDIGNSLSAVEMTAFSLKRTAGAGDSLTQMIANLDASIQSVRSMFTSLLDLARLESGQDQVNLMPVQIGEVVKKAAEEYRSTAQEKGLELRTEGPSDILVHTDPQKIRRIVQNLTLNALQQTTAGSVFVSWKAEQGRWFIRVQDTGPGMQDQVASSIAKDLEHPDRSESSPGDSPLIYQGEGIGLTIVKRLCEQLDAGITLESKLGEGTLFTVNLPLGYDD